MSWLSLRQEQEQKIRQEAMLGMMLELDLMLEGHFDFGNGWHGTTYLNAHPLLDDPYRIYQLTEELKGVIPIDIREKVQLVAGPITGGVLLAKDMAVALDRDRKREEKRVRLATTKDLENHFFLGQVDVDPELVKADKCLCNRIHLPITQF